MYIFFYLWLDNNLHDTICHSLIPMLKIIIIKFYEIIYFVDFYNGHRVIVSVYNEWISPTGDASFYLVNNLVWFTVSPDKTTDLSQVTDNFD
jgi:hypothetical protein